MDSLMFYLFEEIKNNEAMDDDNQDVDNQDKTNNKNDQDEPNNNVNNNNNNNNNNPEKDQLKKDEQIEINNEKIKKYLIYDKLLDMRYKINNIDYTKVNIYKIEEILEYLNVVIDFFKLFEYEQIVELIKRISIELDGVLKNSEGEDKKKIS